MTKTKIAVIGGSGIYDIDGLQNAEWITIHTPWGAPSDQILTGTLEGVDMAFLPRHGRGHIHSPTTVPYRANIDALKRIGTTDIISISACGSFREEMAPGDFVIVDQIHRPHVRPRKVVLRHGLRRACFSRTSNLRTAIRRLRNGSPRRRNNHASRRHIPRYGRPAILNPSGIQNVPHSLGRRRHRHDKHARGKTGP